MIQIGGASGVFEVSAEEKAAAEKERKEWIRTHKEEYERGLKEAPQRLMLLPTRPVNLEFERRQDIRIRHI